MELKFLKIDYEIFLIEFGQIVGFFLIHHGVISISVDFHSDFLGICKTNYKDNLDHCRFLNP